MSGREGYKITKWRRGLQSGGLIVYDERGIEAMKSERRGPLR